MVFWTVLPRVLNYASTWANHTCGSEAQYRGSLILTVATVLRVAVMGSPSDMLVDSSVHSHRGHQCSFDSNYYKTQQYRMRMQCVDYIKDN